jgi:hypothetical protein
MLQSALASLAEPIPKTMAVDPNVLDHPDEVGHERDEHTTAMAPLAPA